MGCTTIFLIASSFEPSLPSGSWAGVVDFLSGGRLAPGRLTFGRCTDLTAELAEVGYMQKEGKVPRTTDFMDSRVDCLGTGMISGVVIRRRLIWQRFI